MLAIVMDMSSLKWGEDSSFVSIKRTLQKFNMHNIMTKIRPSLGKIVTKIEHLVSQRQLAFKLGV
jgi:hypothetical protein